MENPYSATNTVNNQTGDTTYNTLDHFTAGTIQLNDNEDIITYSTIGDYNKMEKLQPQRDAVVPGTSPDVPECTTTSSGIYSAVMRKNGEKVTVHI